MTHDPDSAESSGREPGFAFGSCAKSGYFHAAPSPHHFIINFRSYHILLLNLVSTLLRAPCYTLLWECRHQ